jgi:hypothetical protein
MESIGFSCNFVFIASFHVLGLFIPKKSDALVGRGETFHVLRTSNFFSERSKVNFSKF